MTAPSRHFDSGVPGLTPSISLATLKMVLRDSWLNCWLSTTCFSGWSIHEGALKFSRGPRFTRQGAGPCRRTARQAAWRGGKAELRPIGADTGIVLVCVAILIWLHERKDKDQDVVHCLAPGMHACALFTRIPPDVENHKHERREKVRFCRSMRYTDHFGVSQCT